MYLHGIPKKDYKIIELWSKGHPISEIANILKIEIEYVKNKIIARKVTDKAVKENIFESDKLLKFWKEEEKRLK